MAPCSPSDLPTYLRPHHRFDARYPMARAHFGSAQVRRLPISPTSHHATWTHFDAELLEPEVFAEPGFDDVGAVSRPNNDPGHANKYVPRQNADAPQSCSCRTVTLPMALSLQISSQRSLRHALGRRSVINVPPPTIHFVLILGPDNLQIMAVTRGQYVRPVVQFAASRAQARRPDAFADHFDAGARSKNKMETSDCWSGTRTTPDRISATVPA